MILSTEAPISGPGFRFIVEQHLHDPWHVTAIHDVTPKAALVTIAVLCHVLLLKTRCVDALTQQRTGWPNPRKPPSACLGK